VVIDMTKLRKMADLFRLVMRDTRGVSAVEYVVIIAGVAVFVTIAWTYSGTQLTSLFETAATGIRGEPTAVDSSDSGGSTSTASADNDSDSDSDTDTTS